LSIEMLPIQWQRYASLQVSSIHVAVLLGAADDTPSQLHAGRIASQIPVSLTHMRCNLLIGGKTFYSLTLIAAEEDDSLGDFLAACGQLPSMVLPRGEEAISVQPVWPPFSRETGLPLRSTACGADVSVDLTRRDDGSICLRADLQEPPIGKVKSRSSALPLRVFPQQIELPLDPDLPASRVGDEDPDDTAAFDTIEASHRQARDRNATMLRCLAMEMTALARLDRETLLSQPLSLA
jgi:hypothetical protein